MIRARALATAAAAYGVIGPAPARADRYEASLAFEAGGGAARIGERGTSAELVPTYQVGGRLTHAWSNMLAWDVALSGVLTPPATFEDAEAIVGGRPTRGTITRRTITGRAELGGELRLGGGVGFIPTVRLALGPQLRHRSSSDLDLFVDAVPAALNVDVAMTLGLGFDVRFGRHRVAGFVISATHAQPLGDSESFDAVTVTARIASYWYPRWRSPAW